MRQIPAWRWARRNPQTNWGHNPPVQAPRSRSAGMRFSPSPSPSSFEHGKSGHWARSADEGPTAAYEPTFLRGACPASPTQTASRNPKKPRKDPNSPQAPRPLPHPPVSSINPGAIELREHEKSSRPLRPKHPPIDPPRDMARFSASVSGSGNYPNFWIKGRSRRGRPSSKLEIPHRAAGPPEIPAKPMKGHPLPSTKSWGLTAIISLHTVNGQARQGKLGPSSAAVTGPGFPVTPGPHRPGHPSKPRPMAS